MLAIVLFPSCFMPPNAPKRSSQPGSATRGAATQMLAAHTAERTLAQRLSQQGGGNVLCTLDGHTKVSMKRFDSTRFTAGGTVPCLSLTNIEVASSQRRKGHARTALRALSRVAADSSLVLIVENVVSQHMHTLVSELDGEALFGSRAGRSGAHYRIPVAWQSSR